MRNVCCHQASAIWALFVSGGVLAAASEGPGRYHKLQSCKGSPVLYSKLTETQNVKKRKKIGLANDYF